jgi:hypothetical protein
VDETVNRDLTANQCRYTILAAYSEQKYRPNSPTTLESSEIEATNLATAPLYQSIPLSQ